MKTLKVAIVIAINPAWQDKGERQMTQYRIEYDWAEYHKIAHFQHEFSIWEAKSYTEALRKFMDDWTGSNQVIVTEIFITGAHKNSGKPFYPKRGHKKNIIKGVMK